MGFNDTIKQNKVSVTVPKTLLPSIASSSLNELELRFLIYLLGFLDGNELNAKPIDMKSAAKCLKHSKKEVKKARDRLIEYNILIEVPSKYSKKSYIMDIQTPGIFRSLADKFIDDKYFTGLLEANLESSDKDGEE